MRRLTASFIVAALALTGLVPSASVQASPSTSISRAHEALAFAPVVVVWVSEAQPAVGHHLTIFGRFVNNDQPIRGAQLAVTISLNQQVIKKIRGDKTGAKGVARARFTVPATASAKTLLIAATFTYKNQTYRGLDTVKVTG